MKLKTIGHYFMLAALLSACVKDIELELPAYSSKLVVNGELDNENQISVQVSRSLPIMQANDSSGYLIQNAVVTVYEDNTLLGNASYFSGRFVLAQKPRPGKNYRIEVSSGSYTPVRADVQMPAALPLNVTYTDSVGLDASGFKVGQISLSFPDDGAASNYYKLLIRYYNAGSTLWFPLDLNSTDVIFLNNEKLNDGSYLFSDRTFSGKTKSLAFDVPFGLAMGSPKFEVSVKTFNEDYHDYLKATQDYSQDGNGLSNDPIILKSNVNNGLGMVGGVSNARDTIF